MKSLYTQSLLKLANSNVLPAYNKYAGNHTDYMKVRSMVHDPEGKKILEAHNRLMQNDPDYVAKFKGE